MKKNLFSISIEELVLLVLCGGVVIWTSLFLSSSNLYVPHDHLTKHAASVLTGNLDVKNPTIALGDLAFVNNRYFLFYGPLPTLLTIPFVLLSAQISQHIILFPILVLSLSLSYKLFLYLSRSKKTANYLLAALFLGTFFFFLSSLNITAYTVQVLSVCFLLCSLYFFIVRKNPFITGIFFSLAVLTRLIIILALVFFIIEFLRSSKGKKEKTHNILLFLIPLLTGIVLIAIYNLLRFSSPFDSGYAYNISDNTTEMFFMAKAYGFFSFMHIPGNFYYGFLKVLDPIFIDSRTHVLQFPYFRANPSGFSIFLMSPFFLYIFKAKLKNPYVLSSVVAVIFMLIVNLAYFSSGTWTYGYRYAFDYFPFLFILLAIIFKNHFSILAKGLIFFAIIFNAFYMYSMWGAYPFLPQYLWPI